MKMGRLPLREKPVLQYRYPQSIIKSRARNLHYIINPPHQIQIVNAGSLDWLFLQWGNKWDKLGRLNSLPNRCSGVIRGLNQLQGWEPGQRTAETRKSERNHDSPDNYKSVISRSQVYYLVISRKENLIKNHSQTGVIEWTRQSCKHGCCQLP